MRDWLQGRASCETQNRQVIKPLSILISRHRKTHRDHGKKTERPLLEDSAIAEKLKSCDHSPQGKRI
ncbi:hypothetical protein [Moorena sp. SIO3H5]|uniref:hypothetical protein n=1 Tax=Moorena sp. SIO3H5 TaxID=2607834 RepID=UPI0013B970BB|nr:hypothetical protein [Moorena sp. SIO3H5]NEO70833.1 hypothetical protein [Moorena sp. SIO3H5]